MKIGILTFHRATNCGAALQAYALYKYISNINDETEMIDYIPNNMVRKNDSLVYRLLHTVRFCITPREGYRTVKKNSKFDAFRNNIKMSIKSYEGDNGITSEFEKYDMLISGSDQILNTTLTGDSKTYYVPYSIKRKISYASSFGRTDVTELEKQYIDEYLSDFDAISVREISSVPLLESMINISPKVVCDPVFLLDKVAWLTIANTNKSKNKYIFAYLMEENGTVSSVLSVLKKMYNLPIIVVVGGKINKKYKNRDYQCGPVDFLNYIQNAELIVTNSFHASAMSIIFGKKFCTIAHSSRNARLDSLFEIGKIRDKLICSPIAIDDIDRYLVNGEIVYPNFYELISESKKYLNQNILEISRL